ncbi:MAG: hypothetical protein J1F64_01095 [Oscillospiraceae bacterium]|nr:hypothetical protein [Oscillospiraceae bacterium]
MAVLILFAVLLSVNAAVILLFDFLIRKLIKKSYKLMDKIGVVMNIILGAIYSIIIYFDVICGIMLGAFAIPELPGLLRDGADIVIFFPFVLYMAVPVILNGSIIISMILRWLEFSKSSFIVQFAPFLILALAVGVSRLI